jgi:hypothetical protein
MLHFIVTEIYINYVNNCKNLRSLKMDFISINIMLLLLQTKINNLLSDKEQVRELILTTEINNFGIIMLF